MILRATILVALLGAPSVPAVIAGTRGASQEDAGRTDDSLARLWSMLAPRADAAVLAEDEIADAIVRLGPDAVRPALAIYLGSAEEPELDHDVDAGTIAARPRILLSALERLPRATVLAAIDEVLAGSEEVDRQLDLCRVLGRLGDEVALERILAVAAFLDPIQLERTFVQVPLQESIARIVDARPQLGMNLAQRVRNAPAPLAAVLVRSLADAGAFETATELARAIGRDTRLDLCLAEALGLLGDQAAGNLPESALAPLRRLLDARDDRLVRAASAALARLGDADCADRLIRLLDAPRADLKSAAHAALKALGGQGLPPERAAWEEWLEAERVWSAERLPELEQDLIDADAATLALAIAELRVHRLHRHRAALALLPALSSADPAVAALACAALPGFGSRGVVPALLAHARDPSSAIQASAQSALKGLSRSAVATRASPAGT